MAVILIMSSIPMDGKSGSSGFLTDLDPGLQNLLHIPLYGLLAYLWMQVFVTEIGRSMSREVGRAIIFSLVITIGYGCLDELHQTFIPGRYGGLLDILLNITGAAAGVISHQLFIHMRGK